MSNVTQLLSAVHEGNQHAAEKLLPLVYEELKRLAARKLSEEKPGQTLQATALVHEAYVRLVDGDSQQFYGRRYFFAAAAEAMRRILVEKARRKQTERAGGHLQRQEFLEEEIAIPEPPEDLLAYEF